MRRTLGAMWTGDADDDEEEEESETKLTSTNLEIGMIDKQHRDDGCWTHLTPLNILVCMRTDIKLFLH